MQKKSPTVEKKLSVAQESIAGIVPGMKRTAWSQSHRAFSKDRMDALRVIERIAACYLEGRDLSIDRKRHDCYQIIRQPTTISRVKASLTEAFDRGSVGRYNFCGGETEGSAYSLHCISGNLCGICQCCFQSESVIFFLSLLADV